MPILKFYNSKCSYEMKYLCNTMSQSVELIDMV